MKRSANPTSTRYRVVAEGSLTPAENAAVGGGALAENFSIYPPHSTEATEVFWAKVYEGTDLVGIVPVVKLTRRKATDMLRKPLRKWLGPIIGPLAKKTTLLVDTAFMAYDDRSPFITAPGVDRQAFKLAVSDFLKSQKKVDTVWITEPVADADWAGSQGYAQFHSLPMTHLVLEGCANLDAYLKTLSRNRRRNFKRERDTFTSAGAVIKQHAAPLDADPQVMDGILACSGSSAVNSQFTVPYNDVLASPASFRAQRNTMGFTAELDGKIIGFMSLLLDGKRLMQCHGGLDHQKSHEVLAYHNLIAAAIEYGLAQGCELVSLGPMTNETKRRAGGQLRPMVSSLWNKLPGDRLFAKLLFIKNFEVYRGELGSDQTGAEE